MRLPVEAADLFGLARVGHDRHVHRQHVAPEAGLLPLQREERRDEHAGARDEDERRGDLRDREDAQPAVGARRDPHAAAREAHAIRGRRRWQARHEGEQDGGGDREPAADPEQARIHRDVVGAHREARRIARQHGHHRPRDRDRQHRARAAEHQTLGEQRPSQRARAGAERRANRQLAFAAHRARENQIRDVRARDDEDQRRTRPAARAESFAPAR